MPKTELIGQTSHTRYGAEMTIVWHGDRRPFATMSGLWMNFLSRTDYELLRSAGYQVPAARRLAFFFVCTVVANSAACSSAN